MKSIKTEIMEFLKSESKTPQSRFNQAVALLGRSSGNNSSSLRHYNRSGYSSQRLEGVLYDLQKSAAITDLELFQFDAKPSSGALAPLVPKVVVMDTSTTKAIEKSSDDAKSGFKLRAEYPFLADDDCPEEFLIIVGQKMTAFEKFIEDQEKLSVLIYGDVEKGIEPTVLSPDDLYALGGELIKNWQLNDDIKDELDFYKEHKEILGKHPRMQELALDQDIAKMTDKAIKSRIKAIKTNSLRNERSLQSASTDVKKKEIQDKLDTWNLEREKLEAEIQKRSDKETDTTGEQSQE